MAPTIVLKVKMTCGACVSKVQQTLEALDFVASASVDLKAGEATCTLKDGGAARGEELVAALKAASYEVTACGSGSGKPCPAVAAGTCTCGPLCECGDSCECAACPASCGKAEAACPAKAEGTRPPASKRGWSERTSRGDAAALRSSAVALAAAERADGRSTSRGDAAESARIVRKALVGDAAAERADGPFVAMPRRARGWSAGLSRRASGTRMVGGLLVGDAAASARIVRGGSRRGGARGSSKDLLRERADRRGALAPLGTTPRRCTCGPECRCGPFCACVDCPGGKKALTLSVSITTDLIVGLVAGLAIGFVLASKRAAK